MIDYQSIHLDDLLGQLEKMDIFREVEKFEALHLQESKITFAVDYTPIQNIVELLSLLEIAAMARIVPEHLSDRIPPYLATLYDSQSFRQVSSNHDAFLLISLFFRTSGVHSLYDGDQECLPTFFQFCTLSSGFREDESVQEFCRLMTEPRVQESLDRILSSPSAVVEAITGSRASSSVFTFIAGLSRFLILCREFNDLLKGMEQYPLLQSAYWHYNARIVLMPGIEKLTRLLHKLDGWTEEETTLLFQMSPKTFLRSTATAFEELTEGLYQQELPKRLTAATRDLRLTAREAEAVVEDDSDQSSDSREQSSES
jgi:hypothetical protein